MTCANRVGHVAGHTLTGEIRYRLNMYSQLVLQLEESYYIPQWNNHVPSDNMRRLRWRDATINDLTEGCVV
jgi:hypothetical protein